MKRMLMVLALFVMSGVLPNSIQAQEMKVPDRALYVSMIQEPQVLSSLKSVKKLVEDADRMKIKVLFVQVYRANESWFASKYADDSRYQKTIETQSVDPLLVLIQEAHRKGIEVHAWVNVLSLSANTNAKILRKYGPRILTRNLKKKRDVKDYMVDNQYFLEPSDPDVKKELLAIMAELIKGYPQLDGIQFDYIRYPDVDPHYGYSPLNVEEFKKASGHKKIDDASFVWKDWKRKKVTELLTALVKQTRKLNPRIKISAAGCLPYIRAYDEAFQDWPYWIDNDVVDFLSLMNYAEDPKEFQKAWETAKEKTKSTSSIILSIGAYKFVKGSDHFKEEVDICRSSAHGCAVFHYGSLLEKPAMEQSFSSP